MNTLFSPLFVLTSLSFFISTVVLILGALVLHITPTLWIIPGAFTCTTAYHSLLFLLRKSSQAQSTPWLSTLTVSGAYALTVVWTAVLTITLTYTTLISIRKFDVPNPREPHQQHFGPILISACALSLIEGIILGTIAILSHKDRKRAQYKAKWQWKVTLNTSKWSITKLESL